MRTVRLFLSWLLLAVAVFYAAVALIRAGLLIFLLPRIVIGLPHALWLLTTSYIDAPVSGWIKWPGAAVVIFGTPYLAREQIGLVWDKTRSMKARLRGREAADRLAPFSADR
jgi:hypothetical protein